MTVSLCSNNLIRLLLALLVLLVVVVVVAAVVAVVVVAAAAVGNKALVSVLRSRVAVLAVSGPLFEFPLATGV